MLELDDVLLAQLVVNDRDGERTRLVGQERAVVGGLQVKLEIVQCLALHQIRVVLALEDAALEAAHQALQIAIVNVEVHVQEHSFSRFSLSCC